MSVWCINRVLFPTKESAEEAHALMGGVTGDGFEPKALIPLPDVFEANPMSDEAASWKSEHWGTDRIAHVRWEGKWYPSSTSDDSYYMLAFRSTDAPALPVERELARSIAAPIFVEFSRDGFGGSCGEVVIGPDGEIIDGCVDYESGSEAALTVASRLRPNECIYRRIDPMTGNVSSWASLPNGVEISHEEGYMDFSDPDLDTSVTRRFAKIAHDFCEAA